MKRKQIYLSEELDEKLRKWAVVMDTSEASLVREAVSEYLARLEKGEEPGAGNPLLRMVGFCTEEVDPQVAADHDRFLYGKDVD